jgi:hypothetical protein
MSGIDVQKQSRKFTVTYKNTGERAIDEVQDFMMREVVHGEWMHVEGNMKATNDLIANYIGHDYANGVRIFRFEDLKRDLVFLLKNRYFKDHLAARIPEQQRENTFYLVLKDDLMNAAYSESVDFKTKHVDKILRDIRQRVNNTKGRMDGNQRNVQHGQIQDMRGFDIVLAFREDVIEFIRPNTKKYSMNMKIKLLNDALKRLKSFRRTFGKTG